MSSRNCGLPASEVSYAHDATRRKLKQTHTCVCVCVCVSREFRGSYLKPTYHIVTTEVVFLKWSADYVMSGPVRMWNRTPSTTVYIWQVKYVWHSVWNTQWNLFGFTQLPPPSEYTSEYWPLFIMLCVNMFLLNKQELHFEKPMIETLWRLFSQHRVHSVHSTWLFQKKFFLIWTF